MPEQPGAEGAQLLAKAPEEEAQSAGRVAVEPAETGDPDRQKYAGSMEQP